MKNSAKNSKYTALFVLFPNVLVCTFSNVLDFSFFLPILDLSISIDLGRHSVFVSFLLILDLSLSIDLGSRAAEIRPGYELTWVRDDLGMS